MTYFVNYSIGTRDYQAGPYEKYVEADYHRWDISLYHGTEKVHISTHKDADRSAVTNGEGSNNTSKLSPRKIVAGAFSGHAASAGPTAITIRTFLTEEST